MTDDLKIQYKERVSNVEIFVTISFKKDAMVTPLNSESFCFYCDTNPKKICSRKNKFWLNCQVVADPRGQFLDVSIRYGGSSSDCLSFEASI